MLRIEKEALALEWVINGIRRKVLCLNKKKSSKILC